MNGRCTNLNKKITGQDEIYNAQRTAIIRRYEQHGKINRDLKGLEATREKQLRCRHRDMLLSSLPDLTPDQIVMIKEMLTD
jgi:hypothetical protein